jgi:hypothetical protein
MEAQASCKGSNPIREKQMSRRDSPIIDSNLAKEQDCREQIQNKISQSRSPVQHVKLSIHPDTSGQSEAPQPSCKSLSLPSNHDEIANVCFRGSLEICAPAAMCFSPAI